jgi:hypothetical protein
VGAVLLLAAAGLLARAGGREPGSRSSRANAA